MKTNIGYGILTVLLLSSVVMADNMDGVMKKDLNSDGYISRSEYMKAYTTTNDFGSYDKNNDGRIDRDEMRTLKDKPMNNNEPRARMSKDKDAGRDSGADTDRIKRE